MVFELPRVARDYRLEFFYGTRGKKSWQRLYNLPRIGVGLKYLDYGNLDVLGRVFAIYGFIDQKYLQKDPFTLFGRFGHGLSVHSRIFDDQLNPLNNAIGSHLNLHASLGLRMEYLITPQLALRLGAHFAHQSNARISVPNLGLNTLKFSIGMTWHLKREESQPISEPDSSLCLAKWQFIPKLSLGLKEEKVSKGPKYPVYIIGFQIARSIRQKRRILLGLESQWDMAASAFRRNQDIDEEDQGLLIYNPSLSLGHEYLMGRIGLLTQANLYLRKTWERPDFFAAKIGTNLYLFSNYDRENKQNLFFGIYIKTHLAVADFMEFALGYQF